MLKLFRNGAALLLVAAVLFAGAGTASAAPDPADRGGEEEFRSAAWYFVPAIGRWAGELERTSRAATLKPELACGRDMWELAYRGRSIVEDLNGTPAPQAASAAAARVVASVARLATIADAACADPNAAAAAVAAERQELDAARRALRAWLMAGLTIGTPGGPLPVLPVTGR